MVLMKARRRRRRLPGVEEGGAPSCLGARGIFESAPQPLVYFRLGALWHNELPPWRKLPSGLGGIVSPQIGAGALS